MNGMSRLRLFGCLVAVAVIAFSVPASGKERAKPSPLKQKKHKEGEYGGVTPERPQSASRTRNRYRRPTLTWTGFQPQEGSRARIFFQLSHSVEYEQRVANDVLIVHLPGVRFAGRNAARRVDATFFGTAVAEILGKHVRTKRKRTRTTGVEFRITFRDQKNVAKAKISSHKGGDGFHYLYLDFDPPTSSSVDFDPESDE